MTINTLITATPDVAALTAFHASCFPKSWSSDDLRRMLEIKGTKACVTESGFGLLRLLGNDAELLTLAVMPERRGQGIGLALTLAMLRYLERQDAESFFLDVREGNLAAIAIYKKAGFREISRRKSYYHNDDGQSEDAIVMRCNIR